ncbi:hypothetical protein ACFF2W_004423 [Enterobacter kobei]
MQKSLSWLLIALPGDLSRPNNTDAACLWLSFARSIVLALYDTLQFFMEGDIAAEKADF